LYAAIEFYDLAVEAREMSAEFGVILRIALEFIDARVDIFTQCDLDGAEPNNRRASGGQAGARRNSIARGAIAPAS
jgi:hypothetical protein